MNIVKYGSLYSLSDIHKNITNLVNVNGKFVIRNMSIRLIGISEDSVLHVSINGVSSPYIISDIASIYTKDSRVPYVPYTSFYYVGSDVSQNEFVISIYTEDIIDSISITVNSPNISNAKYAVEYVLLSLFEKVKNIEKSYNIQRPRKIVNKRVII